MNDAPGLATRKRQRAAFGQDRRAREGMGISADVRVPHGLARVTVAGDSCGSSGGIQGYTFRDLIVAGSRSCDRTPLPAKDPEPHVMLW